MRGAPAWSPWTMADVRAAKSNGLVVASTFSGAGGSCTGYRAAGYRVAWASEFVPIAAETYAANAPSTILDRRDIREVKAEEILEAIGIKPGELDLFDGSPPCQSFSTAGNRRVSDPRASLFGDYARLLRGLRPRVFVAENVPGMARGVTKGIFLEVLAMLRAAGYVVECRELDAQWLGVPQARKRLFFVGVRDDLAAHGAKPVFPTPNAWRWSIADACPWLAGARAAMGNDAFEPIFEPVESGPSPTIMKAGARTSGILINAPLPPDLRPEDLEDPSIEGTAIAKEKLEPGQKSKRYLNLVNADPAKPCPTITRAAGGRGTAGVVIGRRKFSLLELRRICGFPDDFELRGSYADGWARLGNAVPPPVARAVGEALAREVLLPRT